MARLFRMMIFNVANDYYELRTDQLKNRLYIKVIGFWPSPDVVPDYVSDMRKATEQLRPGFTVLADLQNMLTSAPSVVPIHEQALEVTKGAGVSHSAEVINDSIANLQMKKMYREHEVNDNKFETIEQAEDFLDQQK